jgi:hypothetical protein
MPDRRYKNLARGSERSSELGSEFDPQCNFRSINLLTLDQPDIEGNPRPDGSTCSPIKDENEALLGRLDNDISPLLVSTWVRVG